MGWRTVHVHWVAGFALPGSRRFASMRRLSQALFMLWLRSARSAKVTIIWTAHNALPHEPVFADDLAARRALVDASRLVITHSGAALSELADLGIVPHAAVVVPHGPMPVLTGPRRAASPPRSDVRRLLYFGNVRDYKGVEDLLRAAARVPVHVRFMLDIVGGCPDPALRARLEQLALAAGERVRLDLRFVPNTELGSMLDDADVVVLPFRRITTSGSAHLAMAHGRPLIIPDLTAFEELPADAVVRYDGTVPGLAQAIESISSATSERLAAMSAAARNCRVVGWDEIALRTLHAITLATGVGDTTDQRPALQASVGPGSTPRAQGRTGGTLGPITAAPSTCSTGPNASPGDPEK